MNTRFRFWNIFLVTLGVYTFFTLVALAVLTFTPASTGLDIDKLRSWPYLRNQLVSFGFSVLFYYFLLNNYYHKISTRKKFPAFLQPSLLALVAIAAYQYISYTFLGRAQAESMSINGRPIADVNFAIMVIGYLFSATFFIGISLLIAYLFYLKDEKKHRKILEEQKMQLEVEKSQANFNFLKAQINPHFLHNTLNFLYAKALPLSADLSEGILTLSDIMRYALSEGNARDGKALLKDEIEHVRNVIKIQQLRFNNQLNVQFCVEGVANSLTIVPFVLITLVENAFKHGDLKNNTEPIVIKLKINDGQLYFYCRNRKKKGPKELSTGIGLENIKKRLDLTYRQTYRFRVSDDNDYYTTELTIDRL